MKNPPAALVLGSLLCLSGLAVAQNYPTHRPRTRVPEASASPTPTVNLSSLRHRASGTFSSDGRTMKIVDGVAFFEVQTNQVLKTRNPSVTLLMTSTPLRADELATIAGGIRRSDGARKALQVVSEHGSDWVSFEIEFDAEMHPYAKQSARWVNLNYRLGDWKQNGSVSIIGDGLKELDTDYKLLQVDPDHESVAIQVDHDGWKFAVDMTMFVREKF